MSNRLPAGSSSRPANGRAPQQGLSSNARNRTTKQATPSSSAPDDGPEDFILADDEIPEYLFRSDYFSIEDQPMLNGFTAANSNLEFPTTTNDLVNLVKDHLKQEQPSFKSTKSTKLSPFITFSSSREDVQDEIVYEHTSKNGCVTYKGLGRDFRLYAVQGSKLDLLEIEVVSVQQVIEFADLEIEENYKNKFLVWSQVPARAVVEEAHYDEIKALRMDEPEGSGQQQSNGGNKGSNGTARSEAPKKPRQKKGRRGRPPKPEEVRDELYDDEFHVAAIVNHWPQYRNRPSASWYLLRFEEGVDEDHWSKEIDVNNDLLEEYWKRRGVENRDLGIAMRKAEKAAAEKAAEIERAAEEAAAEEAAMREIAEKKIAAEMKRMRAERRKWR